MISIIKSHNSPIMALGMVQCKSRIKISDQFSGVIVCQQKTDLKQPTSPCGLGLKTFCFSSDNFF